jgi:predicted branched-subunit amino acid permease
VIALSVSGENVTFTLEGFHEGVRETLPLAVSAFAYGTVIGVLSRHVGLTFTESVLMSGLASIIAPTIATGGPAVALAAVATAAVAILRPDSFLLTIVAGVLAVWLLRMVF